MILIHCVATDGEILWKIPSLFSLCSCWPTSPPSSAPTPSLSQPSLSMILFSRRPLCHSSLSSLILSSTAAFLSPFCVFPLCPHTFRLFNWQIRSFSPSSCSSAAFVCFWFDFSLWLLVERMWCADGTLDWFARDFTFSFVLQSFWWWERVVSRPVSFSLGSCSRRVLAQSQPLHCCPSLQGLF